MIDSDDTGHLVLAIDQGTQSSRAILFDRYGKQFAAASRSILLNRLDRTHVEQDGMEILDSVRESIAETLETVDSNRVVAAGLATQRSSVIAWNRETGKPLSPVLSWQDRREHRWLESLENRSAEIHRLTGLRLTPHYGASKLRWLMHNNRQVQQAHDRGQLALGPLAAFLVVNLTGHYKGLVDHANASRTQLWNLQTCDWDERLLKLFDIDRDLLPRVRPIRSNYGKLGDHGIALTAVNGDQTSALYANGDIGTENLLVNLGTGAFILKSTSNQPVMQDALLSGLCDSSNDERSYLIEGTVNGAGSALRWAMKQHAMQTDPESLRKALECEPEPSLIFINSVGGLGSPWWHEGPPPHWTDLNGDKVDAPNPRAAIASIIESVLFLVNRNIQAIRETGQDALRLKVSGGLSNLDELCQRLANLAGLPVIRTKQPEATARGIAWLALGKPCCWKRGDEERFLPENAPPLQQRYERFVQRLKQYCNP